MPAPRNNISSSLQREKMLHDHTSASGKTSRKAAMFQRSFEGRPPSGDQKIRVREVPGTDTATETAMSEARMVDLGTAIETQSGGGFSRLILFLCCAAINCVAGGS